MASPALARHAGLHIKGTFHHQPSVCRLGFLYSPTSPAVFLAPPSSGPVVPSGIPPVDSSLLTKTVHRLQDLSQPPCGLTFSAECTPLIACRVNSLCSTRLKDTRILQQRVNSHQAYPGLPDENQAMETQGKRKLRSVYQKRNQVVFCSGPSTKKKKLTI